MPVIGAPVRGAPALAGQRQYPAPHSTVTPPIVAVQQATSTNSSPFTTNTATFAKPATAGNIIWAAVAADKLGLFRSAPAGFQGVFNHASSSVTLWLGWKQADGGETTLTFTKEAGTDAAGDCMWIGEFSSADPGNWQVLGLASVPTTEATISTVPSGTTAPITNHGGALAVFAVDSFQSVAPPVSYTNDFVEIHEAGSGGRAGLFVALRNGLGRTAQVSTTMTYAPTADQWSSVVVVFNRVVAPTVDPAFPIVVIHPGVQPARRLKFAPYPIGPTEIAAAGGATQTLSPGGIDDQEQSGLAVLTPGTAALAPGGIGDGSSVGLATLVPGSVTVSPGGIGDGSAVGLTALAQGVAPGGILDGSALGLATLTPGAVNLAPGGIRDGSALGLAVVAALGTPLNPGSVPDTSGVGFTTLTQTLAPAGIPDGSAIGLPSVQLSSLAPGGIRDGSALGLSTVSFTVAPGSIADPARVGLSSLTPGTATVSPGGIGDSSAVGRSVLALMVSVIDVVGRVVVAQTVTSSVDAGGPTSLVGINQTNISSAFATSTASGGVRIDPTEDGRAGAG